MGKKAAKATRKFAASGQLKKTIQQRRKHQDIKRKAERRKSAKKGKERQDARAGDEEDEGEEVEVEETGSKFKGMSVDDLLGGGFLDGGDEEDEGIDAAQGDSDDDDEEDDEEMSEDGSFASVDDLDDDDEGKAHLMELSKLAEKDPEFYKYLQENDKELLDFDPNAMDADEGGSGEEEDDEEAEATPVLTKQILQAWQKALLEQRSLRALRKLLVAFRSAAHMNEDDQVLAWSIDSSLVYNKLVTTSLKYTPVVLDHHCPFKSLPNGKFKGPTQSHKWKTLQKLILSYFHNALHLLTQLTDRDMQVLALTETAKLVPYIAGSRKSVKLYLKTCLDLWSSAEDDVRIAAFLSVRRVASASDESLMDLALKSTYLALVRACKTTSAHTLPSINLMKNSASELYTMDHVAAYQHAFGYVRQLAILLRNGLKVKSKEAYKQVYNWQFVHCVDFWAVVLARACNRERRPLVYPLVQIALGAIKLIPNARSYPYHLHLTRSLLHLSTHTGTYIPLAPALLPLITTTLTSSSAHKASTLRPLDLDVSLRAPAQYLRTRVYAEGVAEEAAFVLAAHLASAPVQGSVGFPELVGPVVAALKRAAKLAQKNSHQGGKGRGKGKEVALVKALVERVEESAAGVAAARRGVAFGPGRAEEVERWEAGVRVEDAPLGRYVRVLRKAREKRMRLVEKAREGEDEILEEEDEEEQEDDEGDDD